MSILGPEASIFTLLSRGTLPLISEKEHVLNNVIHRVLPFFLGVPGFRVPSTLLLNMILDCRSATLQWVGFWRLLCRVGLGSKKRIQIHQVEPN